MHLDYTKVIILILWWRNFQLEYWRNFQLVSTGDVNFEVTNFIVAPDKGLKYTISL
ncbi:Sb-PDE family phosphodiesterase [Phocaeicola vulgatus]|uniref:Sb-PDE family phosphodiesterase n=1 Tax=Phocaeicola vulgatus TaxID=821 RepID=UPI00374D76BC